VDQPRRPDIILDAADQGVVITVNGGRTWSSWYNQPTAQFYHVSTDNAFPYRVCGGSRSRGSVCIAEPRRRRRDHLPRVDAGRRRGVRLRRPRPARTGRRLRRQGVRGGTGARARCRTWRRSPSARRTTVCCARRPCCSRR
jgi:hypothetical protein